MTDPAALRHVEERELDRLFRFMTRPGPRFGLGLAICRDPAAGVRLREQLRSMVEATGAKVGTLAFDAGDARTDLVARMRSATQQVDTVFVVGLDGLLLDDAGQIRRTSAVANLTQRRDSLPASLDARVVFWLSEAGDLSLRDQAWDLRQIMLTVAEFKQPAPSFETPTMLDAPRDDLFHVEPSEIDEAVAHADTLTQVAQQAKDARTRADASFSAGQAYASARRFDAAKQWLARAAEAYDEFGDVDQASAARGMLGRVLFDSGETRDAVAVHETALERYTKIGRLDGQANELANLGVAYLEGIGLDEKAIEFYERALVIDEQLGRLDRQAAVLGNLGLCYRSHGDIAKTIESHSRALAIHQQLGHVRNQAQELSRLGFAYHARGDAAQALELLDQAVAIWEQLGDVDRQAITHHNMGGIAAADGDTTRARDHLTRALELYRGMGQTANDEKVVMISRTLSELG